MPLYSTSSYHQRPIVILLLVLSTSILQQARAQEGDTTLIQQLDSVVVRAFEQNRRLREVPAAVQYLGRQTLERFGPASVVTAVNTTPGVRMEERSPGSYRFNIRGSAQRSPFGVRNVKVYVNDLPYSDPGGNTYLNQLGPYNYQSLEIIKGPGSSLYGAGTGGVLLVNTFNNNVQAGVTGALTTGSYGLQQAYAMATTGSRESRNQVSYQHQQSNGYRVHSRLRRDVVSWNGSFALTNNRQLTTTFIYGDLFYQTPGALNFNEFTADPKRARPAGGGFPGAETARAAIHQKTFLAGASYSQPLTARLRNKTVAYGAYTQLLNPAVRNFGRSSEPHGGGRTVFTFQQPLRQAALTLNAGAEWQQGLSTVSIHGNAGGNADTVQTYDELTNRQSFLFAQATLDMAHWLLMGGVSFNGMKVRFQRFYPRPLPLQVRQFNNEVAPRLSVMRRLGQLNLYGSISRGFSPPTTTELLPTGSAINLDLQAESGTNYELGLKGTFLRRLSVDLNTFCFLLNNSIVQRRDAGGGEFFVNAGKTRQYGVETFISHPLFQKGQLAGSQFWLSHTWHHFRYREFKQVAADFSGNRIPGVAPHTLSTGLDLMLHSGWLATIHYYYSDRVYLNDANDAAAKAYHLLGARLGYGKGLGKNVQIKLTAGADNLLDATYSLGNDINAFGGRYYNAAAGRNYFISLQLQWQKAQQ